LTNPTHIAIDSSGNIYVGSGTVVKKFTNAGSPLYDIAANSPAGLAVSPVDQSLYIVNANTRIIDHYDSTGGPLGSFGGIGTGNGQFNTFPRDVTVDQSGTVYVNSGVSDSFGRIDKFNSSGVWQSRWTAHTFSTTSGLDVDSSGHLFESVISPGDALVNVYDAASGAWLSQWGSFGSADGQFNQPLDLAVDASGNVYVTDNGNTRVQLFGCAVATPTTTPTSTPTATPVIGAQDIVTLTLQQVGSGAPNPKKKDVEGALIKVYNRKDPAFIAAFGNSFGQYKKKLDLIYNSALVPVGTCTTDSLGMCTANEAAPGDYLVIARFADTATNKTVYTAKKKNTGNFKCAETPENDNDDDEDNDIDDDGGEHGDRLCAAGEIPIATRDLKIEKHFKKGVFEKYSGDVVVVSGLPVASSGVGNLLALAAAALAAGLGIGLYARRK
jgi:sugar lactone lactonase YvrE